MDDFIKVYWDNQAKSHNESHCASWGDIYAIDLEIETIAQYINDKDSVLDVGCANGYSTIKQLQKHKLNGIMGIDFSENMIKYANLAKGKLGLSNEIKFKVGDIRKLEFQENQFDVVYTTRVIINLPNWEEQKRAIDECLRVAKPGGKVIFSEAFWEPLVQLNAIRALKGLSPLVEHDFNRYLKKEKLEDYIISKGLKYELNDFSSIYYIGSRFLRELVTDIDSYAGYSNPVNKAFFELEKGFSGGGFGIQQAYIIEKSF